MPKKGEKQEKDMSDRESSRDADVDALTDAETKRGDVSDEDTETANRER